MNEYHQNTTRHLLYLGLPARERDFKHYKGKISRSKSKYEYFPMSINDPLLLAAGTHSENRIQGLTRACAQGMGGSSKLREAQ